MCRFCEQAKQQAAAAGGGLGIGAATPAAAAGGGGAGGGGGGGFLAQASAAVSRWAGRSSSGYSSSSSYGYGYGGSGTSSAAAAAPSPSSGGSSSSSSSFAAQWAANRRAATATSGSGSSGSSGRRSNYAAMYSRPPSLAEKLEVERCVTLHKQRLPVTLLTGFLGSGKTTVVNHILRNTQGKRFAVIENEFGDVGVDQDLLQGPSAELSLAAPAPKEEAEVVLLPNGCLCCKARSDLVDAFLRVLEMNQLKKGSFAWGSSLDGVILEMSGLADVGPVVQTFFAHPKIQSQFRLDAVLCVCDAEALHAALQLQQQQQQQQQQQVPGGGGFEVASLALIGEQLALSDRVLLNKVDLLRDPASQLPPIKAYIRRVAPNAAAVLECTKGNVDISALLGLDSFSLAKTLSAFEGKGGAGEAAKADFLAGLELDDDKEAEKGHTGGLWGTKKKNGGGGHRHHHEGHGGHGGGGKTKQPKQHQHASLGFSSIGLEIKDGPLDWTMFEDWLNNQVLVVPSSSSSSSSSAPAAGTTGNQIVRCKGVAWVSKRTPYRRAAVVQKRVVVQGVYGHLEMEESDLPAPSLPVGRMSTRLVLIGRFQEDVTALKERYTRELQSFLAPGYYVLSPSPSPSPTAAK